MRNRRPAKGAGYLLPIRSNACEGARTAISNQLGHTMPARDEGMTAREFSAWLKHADLTPYAAAPILGISRAQCHRYAADGNVPITVAKLVDMLRRHGIPRDWR